MSYDLVTQKAVDDYHKGWVAYHSGDKISEGPIPGLNGWQEWRLGWLCAEAEMRK
jgi:hypothetical protein